SVPEQALQFFFQRLATHDEVGTIWRIVGAERTGNFGKPFVELRNAATVCRRKRTDDAIAARRDDEFRTGYAKHGCRNQRQLHAPGNGLWYCHDSTHQSCLICPETGAQAFLVDLAQARSRQLIDELNVLGCMRRAFLCPDMTL